MFCFKCSSKRVLEPDYLFLNSNNEGRNLTLMKKLMQINTKNFRNYSILKYI